MPSRGKILDDAEELLRGDIKKTSRIVYNSLLRSITLDTKNGRIVFNSDTIDEINKLNEKILQALRKGGYDKNVTAYLKDFDKIKEETIRQQAGNGVTVSTRLANRVQKSAIQQTTNLLVGNGLDANFIQPVKDVLLSAATSGMTIPQAQQQLRLAILGDRERLGHLERYISQISRDSISQYDGMLQSRIAQEYELDGVSYEGSLIKDSRPQCIRWVGMGEIPVKDLKAEISWAETNGSGMIPGTEPKTFSIYRGGYNCRHTSTAIRI